MARITAILTLTLFVTMSATAQRAPKQPALTIEQYEDSLAVLSSSVLNDTAQANRVDNSKLVEALLIKALKLPKSFEYSFDQLESVSILISPDNAFRIFTWQVFVDDNHYKYGGVIQTADGKATLLQDKAEKRTRPEFVKGNSKSWYGALYYRILPFKQDKQTYYALLGFDGWDFFTKRKVMDVLRLNGSRPEFNVAALPTKDYRGRPVKVCRYIMEYSAETTCRLNWDDDFKMVVFDNLILGAAADGSPANVPDGSYSGYKLNRKGEWEFVEKLFEDVAPLEDGQAPIPYPKNEKKKAKNIFGE